MAAITPTAASSTVILTGVRAIGSHIVREDEVIAEEPGLPLPTLEPLRRKGVLIAGSGMSHHNLREFGLDSNPEADRFEACLTDGALLVQWKNAPGAGGEDAGSKSSATGPRVRQISAFGFGMPANLIS